MRFLFPHDPLNKHKADDLFQKEFLALKKLGAKCSLFDFDAMDFEFRPMPNIQAGETVLYRGWMLSPNRYKVLVKSILSTGGNAFTNFDYYIGCHHLVNWYEVCLMFTPETKFFKNDKNLKENIANLNWDRYFVKDFVKSNTTERGSIANSADEAIEIVGLIEKYRGDIEGGVAVRRVEPFLENTERRYFVLHGRAYSIDDNIPEIVEEIARLVKAPFYSVDTILREDGKIRLVEIGDGQVSDRKLWSVEKFVSMFLKTSDGI